MIRIRDLAVQRPRVATTEVHSREVLVSPGDVLVGMDGEFRARVWAGEKALLNQRVCRFRALRAQDANYLRFAIGGQLEFVERTEVATTVIHLGKSDIDEFRVLVPPEPVRDSFARECQPNGQQQLRCAVEVRLLEEMRGALLPKLLSGELRLKGVQAQLMKVV